MAENVTVMKKNNESAEVAVGSFLTRNKVPFIACISALVAAVFVICIALVVSDKVTAKNLGKLDAIEFELTKNGAGLTTEEVLSHQTMALEELKSYTGKGGITGVRANMLAAEIAFQQNNFEDAKNSWLKAAKSKSGAYTASLCQFNAAVCCENLNDNAGAAELYEKAASGKDFYETAYALFNAARLREGSGDYAKAKELYEKITTDYVNSSWYTLASSRVIYIKSHNLVTE